MIEPFNKLTPAQAERLDMLAEECAEVIMAVSKIKRHGYRSYNPVSESDETNFDGLQREIGDVLALLFAMEKAGDPVFVQNEFTSASKWQRKLKWTHHQGDDK
jgi:NTP pyrophosphatase (non-canonical NTP hydrolase)